MLEDYNLSIIAYLRKPYRFAGEMLLRLVIAEPEELEKFKHIYVSDGKHYVYPVEIEHIEEHAQDYRVHIQDINSRDIAEFYSGTFLVVPERDLNNLGPSPWNWPFLKVQTFDGSNHLLGTIISIEETQQYPMLTIESKNGKEMMMPLVPEFIVDYFHDTRELHLNLPENYQENLC